MYAGSAYATSPYAGGSAATEPVDGDFSGAVLLLSAWLEVAEAGGGTTLPEAGVHRYDVVRVLPAWEPGGGGGGALTGYGQGGYGNGPYGE